MTLDQLLLTLRIVATLLSLTGLGGWALVASYRWPKFDDADRILSLAVGVLLFCLALALSIKAADGPAWLPLLLLICALAGLCASLGYRLKHLGHGYIGRRTN